MATSKKTQKELSELFLALSDDQVSEPKTAEPKDGLEAEVINIFKQAHDHRALLIRFYVIYTTIFSTAVVSLVFLQIQVRLIEGKETVEIIPEWALSLLVIGMFGQFIGLLTIVTKKVWTFEPFLKHFDDHHQV